MLKKINLQLLAEPAAGDPGSGGTPPAATPPAAAATPPASVNFTPDQLAAIDKIAVERAERASKSALTSYFQQQGMTEAQARRIIHTDGTSISIPARADLRALICLPAAWTWIASIQGPALSFCRISSERHLLSG